MRDYRGSKNLIAPLDFLRARKGIRSTDLRPPPGGYSGYSGYSGYWGYMGYSGYLYPPPSCGAGNCTLSLGYIGY